MTTYKITIQKVEEVTRTEEVRAQIREPYDFEAKCSDYMGEDERTKRENDPQYEWQKRPCLKEKETTLLEQTVDSLDLVAVIKAVNGIGLEPINSQ